MGRHGLAAWCFCALTITGRADWGDWSKPGVVIADIVAATRERAEATYTGTTTNYVLTHCGVDYYATQRMYAAASGLLWRDGDECWTPEGSMRFSDPLTYATRRRVLAGSDLIPNGTQTNVWTNAAGSVTSEVVVLYRLDDRHVYTNLYCEAVTSEWTCAVWTNNPLPTVSEAFMGHVDQIIWKMCNGLFIDDVLAPQALSVPSATNWEWDGPTLTSGVWIVGGHTYSIESLPRLTPSSIWTRAGLHWTNEISVVDRGTSYPRTVTSTTARYGWEVGALATYSVIETSVTVQARYITNYTPRYYVTKAGTTYTDNVRLYGIATARTGPKRQARGFGGDLDGLWSHSTGYTPDSGADAVIPWGPMYNWLVEGGVTTCTRSAGTAHGPDGCWTGTRTGEMVLAATWVETHNAGNVMAAHPHSVMPRGLKPTIIVRSAATSEVACAGVDEPNAFPIPVTFGIVGQYWREPTPTSGWALVTATQVLSDVSATLTQQAAHAFVSVSSITVTSAWGSTYYPKEGVHCEVVWPTGTTLYAELGNDFWTYSRSGMEDRKAILQQMKWTQPAAAWVNAQEAAAQDGGSDFGETISTTCPQPVPGTAFADSTGAPAWYYNLSCDWWYLSNDVEGGTDGGSIEWSWNTSERQADMMVGPLTERVTCSIDLYTHRRRPTDELGYAQIIVGRYTDCAPCAFEFCGSSGNIRIDSGTGCAQVTDLIEWQRVLVDYPDESPSLYTSADAAAPYTVIGYEHARTTPPQVSYSPQTWSVDQTCYGVWEGGPLCATGPFESREANRMASLRTIARDSYTVDASPVARWAFSYQ